MVLRSHLFSSFFAYKILPDLRAVDLGSFKNLVQDITTHKSCGCASHASQIRSIPRPISPLASPSSHHHYRVSPSASATSQTLPSLSQYKWQPVKPHPPAAAPTLRISSASRSCDGNWRATSTAFAPTSATSTAPRRCRRTRCGRRAPCTLRSAS